MYNKVDKSYQGGHFHPKKTTNVFEVPPTYRNFQCVFGDLNTPSIRSPVLTLN
jgi:hypothetical protein